MGALSTGLVSGSRSISQADLDARVRRIAAGLAALGVAPGQCVAILMRNDIAFMEAAYAAQTLGAYAVPINWHFKAEEIGYILADCGARVLIGHADLLAPIAADAAGRDHADRRVHAARGGDRLWHRARAGERRGAARTTTRRGSTRQTPYSGELLSPPLTMFYTSGTTGHPKGVRRPAPTPAADGGSSSACAATSSASCPASAAPCRGRSITRRPMPLPCAPAASREVMVLMPRFDPVGPAGADRARAPRHHVHGADHVHPPAQAARGGAAQVRCVLAQVHHPRGGAVSARRQAGHDRLVGAGDQRVLRLDRIERGDARHQRRHAGQARHGGQGGRRRRAAHPRRRRAHTAGGRGRRDLHALRRAARLHLSQQAGRARQDRPRRASSPPATSAISTRTAISSCATASATW